VTFVDGPDGLAQVVEPDDDARTYGSVGGRAPFGVVSCELSPALEVPVPTQEVALPAPSLFRVRSSTPQNSRGGASNRIRCAASST
jgi:hypothetical protein